MLTASRAAAVDPTDLFLREGLRVRTHDELVTVALILEGGERESVVQIVVSGAGPGTITEVVKSGDASPLAGFVFGGCLNADSGASGAFCEDLFTPPGMGRTFRSVAANSQHIAFWGALTHQATFDPDEPFAPADRIGLFRVHLTDPPTIDAIAIDGEPVNNYLGTPDPFFNGATWEIEPWDGTTFDIAPRNEPRQGKSSGVAMNADGLCAFRSRVRLTVPTVKTIGAIFAHETGPNNLRRLALESTAAEPVQSGLDGVGPVVPLPNKLARPIINDAGHVAFYCESNQGTGVFLWDGEMRALLHHGQNTPPNMVHEVLAAPWDIDGNKVQGCELPGFTDEPWYDQPDMNEHGDVVFRALIREVELGPTRSTIWRWTRSTDEYDIVFASGDPLPPALCFDLNDPDPGVLALTGLDETFGRPAINRWGEVAVIGFWAYEENPGFNYEGVFFRDCAGDDWTLALAFRPEFNFAFGADEDMIYDIGPGRTEGEPYRNELSLNDWGQVAGVVHTYRVPPAPYAEFERIAEMRSDLCRPQGIGLLSPTSTLLASGRGGDGDAALEEWGWRLGAMEIDPATGNFAGFFESVSFIPKCAADLNRDNIVNTPDLGLLIGSFGCIADDCAGDVNRDGVVNTGDLGTLLGAFGQNCRPCAQEAGAGAPESLMVGEQPTVSGSILLDMLGFRSVEEYVEFVDSLTEEERSKHFIDVLEIIEEAP